MSPRIRPLIFAVITGLLVLRLAAASAAPVETRIRYAPEDYPLLPLPDGRSEIVRSMLNIAAPMRYGDFLWDEAGIPQGPVWIRVDLDHQLVSVFREGHEIGTAVIIYGTSGKPTPKGVFAILAKDRDHYSSTYRLPMPYMLLLTRDGVAIHGSDVHQGWATHGCIGVPPDFARLLFGAARKGDRVAILPAAPAPH